MRACMLHFRKGELDSFTIDVSIIAVCSCVESALFYRTYFSHKDGINVPSVQAHCIHCYR